MTSMEQLQQLLINTSYHQLRLSQEPNYHRRFFVYTSIFYYDVDPATMSLIKKHFGEGHRERYIIEAEDWMIQMGLMIPYDE